MAGAMIHRSIQRKEWRMKPKQIFWIGKKKMMGSVARTRGKNS